MRGHDFCCITPNDASRLARKLHVSKKSPWMLEPSLSSCPLKATPFSPKQANFSDGGGSVPTLFHSFYCELCSSEQQQSRSVWTFDKATFPHSVHVEQIQSLSPVPDHTKSRSRVLDTACKLSAGETENDICLLVILEPWVKSSSLFTKSSLRILRKELCNKVCLILTENQELMLRSSEQEHIFQHWHKKSFRLLADHVLAKATKQQTALISVD